MHRVDVTNLWKKDGAFELRHRRLGYLIVHDIHTLQSFVNSMTIGISTCLIFLSIYKANIEGRLCRATVPNDGWRRATKPLEIVHSNVCDPIRDFVFIKNYTSNGSDFKEVKISPQQNVSCLENDEKTIIAQHDVEWTHVTYFNEFFCCSMKPCNL